MDGDGVTHALDCDLGDDCSCGALADDVPPTRDQLLESVPMDVTVWPEVDLDSEDPARETPTMRRCVATKKAGGRCTAPALTAGLCCSVHSGLLDPSAGGKAKAERALQARTTAEERSRLAALGARGVIREVFAEEADQLRAAVRTLVRGAAQGDLASAKLVATYLNQGLGMPTETVDVRTPQSGADLAAMSDEALHAWLQGQRAGGSEPGE